MQFRSSDSSTVSLAGTAMNTALIGFTIFLAYLLVMHDSSVNGYEALLISAPIITLLGYWISVCSYYVLACFPQYRRFKFFFIASTVCLLIIGLMLLIISIVGLIIST